jgi:hypothetical protein
VHFHICVANHVSPGRESLKDSVDWLVAGLEENDHVVTMSETSVDAQAMNLFWEGFLPQFAESLVAAGVKYGIVCTEAPDGAGFNNRRGGGWGERWDSFKLVAQQAKFLWCSSERFVEAYAKFAPAAYLELGFSERLVPSDPRPEPTHDFSFTGSFTNDPSSYRRTLLKALGRHATVNFPDRFLSNHAEQTAILRSGRVSLALKQDADWIWPSTSRIGRLIHERIPVAAEWTPIQIGASRLVPQPTEYEDFIVFAVNLLSLDLERQAEAVLERYREAMPMRACVARMLDETLGRQ